MHDQGRYRDQGSLAAQIEPLSAVTSAEFTSSRTNMPMSSQGQQATSSSTAPMHYRADADAVEPPTDVDADTTPHTRREAISTALAGLNAAKRSRVGVVFLKGGLAVAQVTLLITLLVLSRRRRRRVDGSAAGSEEEQGEGSCPSTHLLDGWMIASAVRLTVCWSVSLWILARRSRSQQGAQDDEDDSIEAEDVSSSSSSTSGSSALEASAQDKQDQQSRTGSAFLHRLASALDWLATKLSALLLATSIALFIWGNVLVWSSVNTCKRSEPLLWWGVTSIVAVGWFLLVEVAVVVLGVGLVGPSVLAALRWIKVLPPLPPVSTMGPLPAPAGPVSVQDAMALTRTVCYVPYESKDVTLGDDNDDKEKRSIDVIAVKSPLTAEGKQSKPVSRFRIFGRHRSQGSTSNPRLSTLSTSSSTVTLPVLLTGVHNPAHQSSAAFNQFVSASKAATDRSESRQGFPFPVVRLPAHVASCTICLADFQPSASVDETTASISAPSVGDAEKPLSAANANAINVKESDSETTLRLLPCGHVFHDRCIVPWLTQSSGRCPLCNRALKSHKPETESSV